MHCVSALNAGARGLWKRTMEHSSEAELSAYIRRVPGSIPGVPISFWRRCKLMLMSSNNLTVSRDKTSWCMSQSGAYSLYP